MLVVGRWKSNQIVNSTEMIAKCIGGRPYFFRQKLYCWARRYSSIVQSHELRSEYTYNVSGAREWMHHHYNNVWIGAGAIILPNVKIEMASSSALGGGNKIFSANQVIGGVPAKLIKERHWWFARSVTLLCEANQILCCKNSFFADSKFACVAMWHAMISPFI